MRWRLIPRDEAFFQSFVTMATEIRSAATLFQEMVTTREVALTLANVRRGMEKGFAGSEPKSISSRS